LLLLLYWSDTRVVEVAGEKELVEAARGGDAGALDKLIEEHQDQIYRFGMKMCRHPEDAEDVLQETLLTMARSIGDFRGKSSLSTWLYSIARSFCIKKRRKSKFAPEREHSLEHEASVEARRLVHPGRPPDQAVVDKETLAALDAAIRSLEPGQQEVFLLRDIEGLKASEVGEVLGISVAAVKSRLHRARARIREMLVPTLETEELLATDSCPDVLKMYSERLEDELSPELCAEMDQHLQTCKRCQSSCDSLKQTLALCKQVPAEPVPASVQERIRAAVRKAVGPGLQ
jgi:RNA polymerase sigma-70 factor (ECF subfamily)